MHHAGDVFYAFCKLGILQTVHFAKNEMHLMHFMHNVSCILFVAKV